MRDVIVIGGGPAGMLAALAAARQKARVRLLEKNEKLGKKLYITGKGRCNITNGGDMEDLFEHVVTNKKFLYSAFYGFTNQDIVNLLGEAGLKVKTERGKRIFPVSDKSSDVIKALTSLLEQAGVDVRLRTEVQELMVSEEEPGEERRCLGVMLAGGEKLFADRVIVACGGFSYQATGSTGDGYRLAQSVGHRVTELSPALVPIHAKEEWVKDLQGLSLKNVEVSIWEGKKCLYREFGEMLFTHFGVSGPAVLSGSSYIAKKLKKKELTLSIDLKPALDQKQLDERFLRDFSEAKNKRLKNALDKLFPNKLIPVFLQRLTEEYGISSEKQVNEVTRAERERMVSLTKHFTLTLTALGGYQEAIITQGGISVKEINPSTMESKLVRGLYFAGEELDLDAVTGGYNLQIAWSTGWLAGQAAGEVF